MTVRVLFFSILRDLIGIESYDLKIEAEEVRVGDAVSLLLTEFPQLGEWEDRLLLAVDCEYANREDALSDGCEFALFPPVQGG